MNKLYFGIDVGGTTVKFGTFSPAGELLDKWEIPTDRTDNGAFILKDISDVIKEKLSSLHMNIEDIAGIGIGIPGPVTDDGVVHQCPNLGWETVNVKEELSSLTGISNISVGNDANVAALGEAWKGGGSGAKNAVMITLGTGVGGGIIIDGKIHSGARGGGGEIGHIRVNFNETDLCGCGRKGCLEQYTSATGIVKEAVRLLERDSRESVLRTIDRFTAKDIFDSAKNGDELSIELVEQLGRYLGLAASYLSQIVDPEVFIIGGGVSRAGKILTDVIRKNHDANVMDALKHKEFCLAKLDNDAGIYGAVKMVL